MELSVVNIKKATTWGNMWQGMWAWDGCSKQFERATWQGHECVVDVGLIMQYRKGGYPSTTNGGGAIALRLTLLSSLVKEESSLVSYFLENSSIYNKPTSLINYWVLS